MEKKTDRKIDKAWEFYEKENYDQALKICNTISNSKQYAIHSNYLIGLIYYDKNQFREALKALNKSLELDVKKTHGGYINYWIARTFANSGSSWLEIDNPVYDKEKAILAFEESKQYDKYPVDTLLKLISYTKTDFDKIFLYNEGIKKFPLNPYFYIYSGKLNKKMGYPSRKIEILEDAISKGIQSASLFFNIGTFYYEQKEYKKGIEYFTKSAKELINNAALQSVVYYCIGNCNFELKEYEKAIFNYKSAIELDGDDSSVWYNVMGLVSCYSKIKQLNKNIIAFREYVLRP